jgi:hypothetical protein
MLRKGQRVFLDEDDHIYYNIRIQPSERGSMPARYSETRVQPIIEDPSRYEMAVVRFSVPMLNMPILFFRDGTAANGWTPDQAYYVTLSFDGYDAQQQLVWLPNTNGAMLYGKPDVWHYNEMLGFLNTALAAAFVDLKANKPLAPPTQAPFVTFDQDAGLFTLWAEQLYDSDGPPTATIYFNSELFRLFSTLQIIGNFDEERKENIILVRNRNNNSGVHLGQPYYQMTQESSTLSLWGDLRSLQFQTSSIPVNPEYLPGQTNQVRRVITDFEPIDEAPSRSSVQYYPQGPLRYYSLNASTPLRQIDLDVVWIDRFSNTYPVYINREDQLTVKIAFRRIASVDERKE